MGVVYAAHDTRRDMRVAIKTMRSVSPRSLYRFKREFRALTELSHPNIVQLHELIASDGDQWWLTMELIEGRDLLTHVGARELPSERLFADDGPSRPSETVAETTGTIVDDIPDQVARPLGASEPFVTLPTRAAKARPLVSEIVDLDSLRAAMRQLAAALSALHRNGIVHRDLKPSNVMVTAEGRVVLMDFGVVAELQLGYADPAEGRALLGTPAYMAPEQGMGLSPSAAADWYAFGVILYRALTGTMPYHGPARALLDAKQTSSPTPVTELVRELPIELGELCMRLLSRRPDDRPSSTEIFACLRDPESTEASAPKPATASRELVFVGRAEALAELAAAHARALARRPRLVELRGAAGIGKSHTARRFIDQLEGALVLRSRCRERESVPYRAFDEAIDALCVYLEGLDDETRAQPQLDELAYLARLFPVLKRLPEARRVEIPTHAKPAEVRARALAALRQLFVVVAQRQTVVLLIEDLQWVDDDSAPLLAALFDPALDAAVLVLATARTQPGNLDASSQLEQPDAPGFARLLDSLEAQGHSRRVHLGRLSSAEQRELIERLTPEHDLPADTLAVLEQQAEGHPLLLHELTRALRTSTPLGQDAPTLAELIRARVRRLPVAAQTLLEVLVVAGEMLPSRELALAAGLDQDTRERAVRTLDLARLVRPSGSVTAVWLDVYQDQIREALFGGLAPELVGRHAGALAPVLERWGEAAPALLARLWQSAGALEKAASYEIEAARLAASQLAFGRARSMYLEAARLAGILAGDTGLRLRYEAWVGLAQLARGTGATAAFITEGEGLVRELEDTEQLPESARVHYLLGSLLMTRGDLEGCADNHRAALEAAKLGSDVELQARALGGLGDAEFMHGRMSTCEGFCREAIALSHAHGLPEVEAAQLALGASNRFFDADIGTAQRYVEQGLRLGDPRCKAIALSVQVWCELHGGRLDQARECNERYAAQVETFGLDYLRNLAALNATEIELCDGDRPRAEQIVTQAIERARREKWIFPLVSLLGAKAWACRAGSDRDQAIADGLAELGTTGHAHERMHFYRLAIEATLDSRAWDRVDELCDRLDALTRGQRPGWMKLVLARARVLARLGRGERDVETLMVVRHASERAGFMLLARSLAEATSTATR